MQIVCTICSEVMNQTASIRATKCGHIFHHHCLMQWINISQTCPQCRNYVTDNCMFRLYLTMENSKDDITLLESKLESAQQELKNNKELAEKKEKESSSIINDLLTNLTDMKQYEIKVKDQENEIKTLQISLNKCNETISKQSHDISIILRNRSKQVGMCEKLVKECEEKLNSRELALTALEELLGELLKASEEKLISRKLAVAALEEEMNYVKQQDLVIDALKQEKAELEEKLQALDGRVKKLATHKLKRQKLKRKASDDERVVKRKRSSIYSSIDDAVFTDTSTEYTLRPAISRSKKLGRKLENRAINSRPQGFWKQPSTETGTGFLEAHDQNASDKINNILKEYTECDMLHHLQFQLQIS